MPTNRIGCSMIRLLCLRLHARPSGATLDHRHIAMTGHSFRLDTDKVFCGGFAPHKPLIRFFIIFGQGLLSAVLRKRFLSELPNDRSEPPRFRSWAAPLDRARGVPPKGMGRPRRPDRPKGKRDEPPRFRFWAGPIFRTSRVRQI